MCILTSFPTGGSLRFPRRPPVACLYPLDSYGVQDEQTPQSALCAPLCAQSWVPSGPSFPASTLVCSRPSTGAARCRDHWPWPGSWHQALQAGFGTLQEPRIQKAPSFSCTATLQTVRLSLSASQRLRVRALELRACQGENLENNANKARVRSAHELIL